MNDGMLLQINRVRNLIPEHLVKEALAVQEQERAAGKSPRPLLEILETREDLSTATVKIIRSLKDRGNPDQSTSIGEDPTVIDGFHAVVESVILAQPERAPGTSKVNWPPEVHEAEKDVKNIFGQFVLVAQVGSGGSGTVYRAWDRRVGRYSGVKILHTMEPSALERFTREARIAGNLQHPSIATIYEVGETDGRYYIAMKYIDGRPIDADPRSIPECLALIRDACRALDYAHQQGIIHRDIKPANLLVDSNDHVYVTDFGIAKQAAHDHTSTLSMTGTIIGTPKYLPPEQARGEAKRADARSDVYSIGATLYTLLAGRAPFPSSNVWETLESVMKRDPPALTSLNGAVSPELERIVAKAMSKDPANRFPSAGLLADELDRILQQRRYTGRYGLLRYLARKWVAVALFGVAIGVLVHLNAETFFLGGAGEIKPVTAEDRYKVAAGKLIDYMRSYETYKSVDERKKFLKFAQDPVDLLLKDYPEHLHGRVFTARRHFVEGEVEKAEEALAKVKSQAKSDYRIGFIDGLIRLEKALDAAAFPFPMPDAPTPTWDAEIFRLGELRESFAAPSEQSGFLKEEWSADLSSLEAAAWFVQGKWQEAAQKLKDASSTSPNQVYPMPVFRKLLHRATYLDMNWPETRRQREEPWHPKSRCRECFGAGLALATRTENANSVADLQELLKECNGDAGLAALVQACIARRSVERGLNPTPAFDAVDKLPSIVKSELRGVARVAQVRWTSLSGGDIESEAARALDEIGENPTSWMGRLARIEALIALANHRRFRGEDAESPLTRAWQWAEQLPAGDGWKVPAVLRAEIHLRRGEPDKALVALPSERSATLANLRLNLVAAEAQLRKGRTAESASFAKLALETVKDHPEALRLWAASLLEDTKRPDAPSPAAAAVQAVDLLTSALNRVPDYVPAHYERAWALFLVADHAAFTTASAHGYRLAAYADLKKVTARYPRLEPAKALMDHLWELLSKSGSTTGLSK